MYLILRETNLEYSSQNRSIPLSSGTDNKVEAHFFCAGPNTFALHIRSVSFFSISHVFRPDELRAWMFRLEIKRHRVNEMTGDPDIY